MLHEPRQRRSWLIFDVRQNMLRIAPLIVFVVVVGCVRTSERSTAGAAAIVAAQILEAAKAEDGPFVHLKVEGASADEVVKRSQSAGSSVTFLTGTDEPEYRDGRLRVRSSDRVCYAIKLVVEELSAKSVRIQVYWNASFGGFSVTTYMLSYADGAWKITEERLGLIT
jgi:hypothetical protein